MQYQETSQAVALGVGPGQAVEELSMPWQQALEAVGDGVWEWDVPNDHMRYCGRLAAMLGHDPAMLGCTEADAGHWQHPADRPEVSLRLHMHLSAQWPAYVVVPEKFKPRPERRGKTTGWSANRGHDAASSR